MKKTKYVFILLAAVLCILGIVGLSLRENPTSSNSSIQLTEDKDFLLVGMYEKTKNEKQDEFLNSIHVNIWNDNEEVYSNVIRSDSNELIKKEEFKGFVFFDLTEIVKQYTNNSGIETWSNLVKDTSDNTLNGIYVSIEHLGTESYLSSQARIAQSGIYRFATPIYENEEVAIERTIVYVQ